MSLSFFSKDYSMSRKRFLDAAESSRHLVSLESLPLKARGPADEKLAIDIAWIGSKTAERIFFHTSGLHGLEGFAGAAIQLKLLENLNELPDDVAVILVHGLNPFGMAWLRRVNENNVDLNRNFLRASDRFEGVPGGYRILDALMNPNVPTGRLDLFRLNVLFKILRHGFNPLKQAVMEGQYEIPKGLFFGGQALEVGPRAILEWARKNIKPSARVVAVDVHVGLGRFGDDILLVPVENGSDRFRDLRTVFGSKISGLDPEKSVAYRVRGGFHQALMREIPDVNWYCVSQEFGAYSPIHSLAVLRAENAWHQWGRREDHSHFSKKLMWEAFCPASPIWRENVLSRGLELATQGQALACDGVSG